MSQTLADVFKLSCIKLAQTIIINHPYAGMVINKRLAQEGFGKYTNDQDKNTWKFYKNMAGIYHAYDEAVIHRINQSKGLGLTPGIDQSKMIIRVASDNGTIEKEFTLGNISNPDADDVIALEYQQGTRLYDELLETYPHFEALIKGILHPIPLITSTTASDFDVLYAGGYYRTRLEGLSSRYGFIKGAAPVYRQLNLIEEWEESLIDRIQEFSKIYFRQYDNPTYAEFNDLAVASNIGIFYLNIPTTIMSIRNELTKTREVNSNHVQFYLDSFLNVGQYIPYLTRNQYMYLYRNVEWLSANAGKEKVLEELNTHILKERGIALIDYEVEHDIKPLPTTGETKVSFTRLYDKDALLIDTKKNFNAKDIIELENYIARDNSVDVTGQIRRVESLGKNSPNSNAKTKIIETHFATSERTSYISKEEFLFNNWAYSAINDEYKGIIVIQIPGSTTRLQLTVKNALYLFLYAYAKAGLGIEPETLPKLILHHIPKIKTEADGKEYLKSLTIGKGYSDKEFDEIYNNSPEERRYNSIRNFGLMVNQHWNNYVERNFVYHRNLDIDGAAELEMICEAMYMAKPIQINLGMDLDNWVDNLGYNISGLNNEALSELYKILFNSVLSIDDTGVHSMDNIHKALINVIKVFTSYNIQFITKTASKAASDVGVKLFRMNHISTDFSSDDDLHILNYPVYKTDTRARKKTDEYGWELFYTSSDDEANLLTQEQLKALILTEENQGILHTRGLH